jgi:hypothetical protein
MTTTRLRSLTCLIVCTLSVLNAVSQVNWREYSYPDDGFSFAAPAAPVFEKSTTPTAVGPIEQHTYSLQLGPNAAFMVSTGDFNEKGSVSVKDLLEGAKKGAAERSNGAISKERDVTLEGNAGIEFELANAAFHSRVRCFFINKKLLTMMAVASTDKPIPAEADRFFDSFRLIKKSSSQAR